MRKAELTSFWSNLFFGALPIYVNDITIHSVIQEESQKLPLTPFSTPNPTDWSLGCTDSTSQILLNIWLSIPMPSSSYTLAPIITS